MNHAMRRSDRKLPEDDAKRILMQGEYGILSTIGEDGFPYGVPLSYACDGEKIYFHCAADAGHKIENLNFSSKACFTVVGKTQVLPDKFTTNYESVMVFGTVSPAGDKLAALEKIREKYSPDFEIEGKKYAKASEMKVAVYELRIMELTGKARNTKDRAGESKAVDNGQEKR